MLTLDRNVGNFQQGDIRIEGSCAPPGPEFTSGDGITVNAVIPEALVATEWRETAGQIESRLFGRLLSPETDSGRMPGQHGTNQRWGGLSCVGRGAVY